MPRRLIAIGAVYCLVGAVALVSMILSIIRDHGLHMDLTVFLLPVGFGLLRARPSSRRWATFWAGLAAGIALTVTVWALLVDVEMSTTILGVTLPGATGLVVTAAVIVSAAAFTIWTLYTAPVSSVFTSASHDVEGSDTSGSAKTDPSVGVGGPA